LIKWLKLFSFISLDFIFDASFVFNDKMQNRKQNFFWGLKWKGSACI